ncbi:MAG: tRNA N6-adenosine threonylcarbamoyltransferase [Planctomycetes bacterium]|nr:tRNA N6-adenosine threonylcarbamoyltransferase [Planctomycetota bacterium]
MLVLGIDSSCDETAAAVVRDGREQLSSVVASQAELHRRFGGVVPELACRAHVENYPWAVDEALRRAGVTLADIDGIAVTNRPGLVSALLVGVSAAKALALATGKPLVGVDHIVAHIHASCLLPGGGPEYPAVALVVSGGHTSLYLLRSPLENDLLGATLDDAAGETFDKVAQILRLPYPGGPSIDKAAREGDPSKFPLPRTQPRAKGADGEGALDFSFSGMKTAVLYRAFGQDARPETARTSDPLVPVADVCAGLQAAIADVLVQKTMAAVRKTGVRQVVLGGGVACNSELRKRMTEAGAARGLRVLIPPPALCTDNAAMVAVSGWFRLSAGERDGLDMDCHPRPVRAAARR